VHFIYRAFDIVSYAYTVHFQITVVLYALPIQLLGCQCHNNKFDTIKAYKFLLAYVVVYVIILLSTVNLDKCFEVVLAYTSIPYRIWL